jgi:hypothetical protein
MSSTPRPRVSDEIWAEIKDIDIGAFGLPGQMVSKFCAPITVEPSKLYLKYTMSAVVSFMSEALGSKYDVEAVDAYIIVARKGST